MKTEGDVSGAAPILGIKRVLPHAGGDCGSILVERSWSDWESADSLLEYSDQAQAGQVRRLQINTGWLRSDSVYPLTGP
ncbi:hypothetical protein NDU88_006368 [Pleurodeles waltl]|uniref:Uncharacterized protein n=1 Tax=Pleurodeles waltl TaxID=8319 RepID=A0AAV7WEG8_PLEWA|nr:hypothetical protein NDU88_006368 [Pleurodeles waltl]